MLDRRAGVACGRPGRTVVDGRVSPLRCRRFPCLCNLYTPAFLAHVGWTLFLCGFCQLVMYLRALLLGTLLWSLRTSTLVFVSFAELTARVQQLHQAAHDVLWKGNHLPSRDTWPVAWTLWS